LLICAKSIPSTEGILVTSTTVLLRNTVRFSRRLLRNTPMLTGRFQRPCRRGEAKTDRYCDKCTSTPLKWSACTFATNEHVVGPRSDICLFCTFQLAGCLATRQCWAPPPLYDRVAPQPVTEVKGREASRRIMLQHYPSVRHLRYDNYK